MTMSLDALKSAFATPENTQTNLPNNYYPFWNMEEDESCIVRFLPDANTENPMGFMVEKVMHNLTINGERKSVPCLSMYGEDCPICKVSQDYYKAEGQDSVNGKKYWKKKQHIAQALVVADPLPANKDTNETHEGQVRLLSLGFQIFKIIKDAFESGELDEVPYAYENGTDFIIKKTTQGKYASYSTGTKFARKSSDLADEQIEFSKDNITDLASVLPKHPGREKVEAMLEADLSGGTYNEGNSAPAAKAPSTPAPSFNDDIPSAPAAAAPTPTPAAEPASDDDDDNEADRILAQIRARKANAG